MSLDFALRTRLRLAAKISNVTWRARCALRARGQTMRYGLGKGACIAVLSLGMVVATSGNVWAEDPAATAPAAETTPAPTDAAAPADPVPAADAPVAEAPAAPAADAAPAAAATDPAPATPAAASDGPAFVGTWSADLTQCQNPQESESAPMIITAAGLDQHEVHCSFKDTKTDGTSYKIAAECSVEGASEPHDMSFAVNGDTLTITDEAGANTLSRCK